MVEREESGHQSYNRFQTIFDSGDGPTPDDCMDRAQVLSETGSPRTWPDIDKQFQQAEIASPSMSEKTLRSISFESDRDDQVFVEIDHYEGIHVNGKSHIKPTPSTASTETILPNPYNKFNHRVHSVVWCSCCLYVAFICCLPAVHYMQESDKAYRYGDELKARRTGKMSTLMFVAGTFIALAVYVAIVFLVIFLTVYNV